VPRGEKSGVVIEPLLSDQWFVQVGPLAEPAIKAVENGDITFNPKQAENIYFAWMRDLKDWCISRQQWWGHRIPAWYNDAGEVFVGKSEAMVRAKYQLSDAVRLRQDEDVLDTWFSSALWTFSTLGWPEDTAALKTFHSTDLMVTGHDIISFWVSRMIMMTLKFMDEVPFKEVYIHGLVTDAEGQKMSKSKGNGLDPMDIIDGISAEALIKKRTENLLQERQQAKIERATRKEYPDGIAAYGTDALRFTFCAIATSARSMRFDLKRVEGYRNFCNKLWNAANYVLMSTAELTQSDHPVESVADQWIRLKFQETSNAVNQAMNDYRFDLAAKYIYEFVWDEFCDWYLELCKPVLLSETASDAEKAGTQTCLLETLEATLRLAHPFMPFITEELWQKLPTTLRRGPSLMLAEYPKTAPIATSSEGIFADILWIKEVVGAVRNIRGEQDIPPSKLIPILLQQGSTLDRSRQVQFTQLIAALARPETLTWIDDDAEPPPSAIKIVGDLKILVPLAGLIDVTAELERMDKEINKIIKEITRIQNKLGNEAFVKNAPPEIVAKEKAKIQDYLKTKTDFESQKARIQNI
jgi:valyl-tRNA synthetase